MEKELFIKALYTLHYSWGGDTPSDAIWAANEFLDYFEKVNGITLSGRFEEVDSVPNWDIINDNLLEEIKNLP